jgi:hypothetical protein
MSKELAGWAECGDTLSFRLLGGRKGVSRAHVRGQNRIDSNRGIDKEEDAEA